MSKTSAKQLDLIAQNDFYETDTNSVTVKYSHDIFSRYFRKGSILELGPAEGVMTERLYYDGVDMTAVEGSKLFCDILKKRFPDLTVHHSLFEEYQPDRTFDNIILGHVLEHVDDAVQILSLCRTWLSEGGRVFAAVPNAMSLHRQGAVIMGLLDSEKTMSELDYRYGHQRVFDPISFREPFTKAGLCIERFGGYWLKPVSNDQIEKNWSREMLDAFMQLGERYPDIAGEIYVIAGHPTQ